MSPRSMSVLFPALALALGACGGDSEDPARYYDGPASAALGAASNQATCATCHSDDGTQIGYSGNTLVDSAYRISYKGGTTDLLGAVNECVVGWMGGAALAAGDPAFVSLEAFMRSLSSPEVTAPLPIEPEVLANLAAYEEAYAGGDAAAGQARYAGTCARCHDQGLVVGQALAFPRDSLGTYSIGAIARKVRTSGPPPSGTEDALDLTGGPMPFFELKDLPAQDLRDIIAYVKQ
jgi:mono/diheme cytochrome c family protein